MPVTATSELFPHRGIWLKREELRTDRLIAAKLIIDLGEEDYWLAECVRMFTIALSGEKPELSEEDYEYIEQYWLTREEAEAQRFA